MGKTTIQINETVKAVTFTKNKDSSSVQQSSVLQEVSQEVISDIVAKPVYSLCLSSAKSTATFNCKPQRTTLCAAVEN